MALNVGGSLASRFLGADWYTAEVVPLIASLHAVRDTHPIDSEALRDLGK